MAQSLMTSIIADLGSNYRTEDADVLTDIYNEVVDNALRFSNRQFKTDRDAQIEILASDIRRCVKTIYLQRGAEDVSSQTQSGLASTYDDAMEKMRNDIYKGNKRILL